MCTPTLNTSQAEAFAERMMGMLNDGALALMTSIGHRTGLFDTMAMIPPATSAQIAEAAGLHERYVREWLGAMVVGRIVDYDTSTRTYSLAPEHAAFLTRAAGADNMALFMQYVPLLATVEDEIVACFKHGGGVPYSRFGRFQEVMADDSNQTVVAALLESILPLAPGMIDRLNAGIDVLDIGCGRGRALSLLAQTFPASRFTGYDLSESALAAAREDSARLGLRNVSFETRDVTEPWGQEQYDLITAFDAIHDQAHPDRVLTNIYEALRPGATFLMQDIAGSSEVQNNMEHPVAPFLYTVSCMHCMTVSLAQGGAGLGTMWGKEKALEMLAEAGFGDVAVHELPHDFQNYFYVTEKPA
jgi:2-polyprenyl-3-methyl-5-hydroxy-6-metoxy-1,4-benzoquinol methylase